MRIGLYGGSFNPVHYGHVRVAQAAVADLALDRLVVLPAHVSPFKADAASAAERQGFPWDRLASVHDAFDGMEKVVVDEREVRRGGVSYAIDTVREVAAENPGAALFYVIGEDSVAGLPRWKEIDALRRLVTFKAYPRTKESSTEIRALFRENGVTLNPDGRLVAAVREGLRRKRGFCPCRVPKLPAFFCPCDEFRGQLRDPSFRGLCHCRLYLKP